VKNKFVFLIPVLILIDQLLKNFFKDKIYVIFNYPLILYKKNTGAAFGILEGNNLLLLFLTLIILGILIYLYLKNPKLRTGLSFIIAGATSNLIDRIFHGFIIDYINLGIYPTFNLADVFNIVGAIILVFILTKK